MREMTDGVVTLTSFSDGDAEALRDADGDPEHRRWFDFPDDFVPSLRHSLDVIARWRRERALGRRFPFAVRDAATGTLLGGCELRPAGAGAANLSYWTHPAHRGRGIATRAVALVCRVAFEDIGFERVEILTDSGNHRSRSVAIRNGFREAGRRDGRLVHVLEAGL